MIDIDHLPGVLYKVHMGWLEIFLGGVLTGGVATAVVQDRLNRRANRQTRGYQVADDALRTIQRATTVLADYWGVLLNDDLMALLQEVSRDLRRDLLLIPNRRVRASAFRAYRLLDHVDVIESFAKGANPVHLRDTDIWLRVLGHIGDVLSAYRRGDRVPAASSGLLQVEQVWREFQAR